MDRLSGVPVYQLLISVLFAFGLGTVAAGVMALRHPLPVRMTMGGTGRLGPE